MSTLAENVAKVTAAHAALKEAIAAKGVAVPEGTKLSDMPALVGEIQAMPATVRRAVFAYDQAASIVVQNKFAVDLTTEENLAGLFSNCSSLTSLTLPDGFGQNAKDIANCFNRCSQLTSLTLPDGFGQNAKDFYGCFNSCSSLTTITGNPNFKVGFSLSSSPNLTHDSLMVVINGLQTVTSAQTLTLGATNLAKLTDEEKKVATDKGWTLA